VKRVAPEPARGSLSALRVYERCPCGCASVSFVPGTREHVLVGRAECKDTDGVPVWVLLFGSRDGSELDELEVQRADGLPIRQLPAAETLVTSEHL
jgi:hypothetical protein